MKKWGKHNAIAAVVLGAVVVFGVLATKRTAEDTSPPAAGAVDQRAVNAVLALPEIKSWAAEIEQRSGGRVRGAVIGGDAEPKTVDGVTYYAYSFMENDPEQARRLQGFYVTQDGSRILVEDALSGDLISLEEWRAANAR
jgi:hypothetical protein